MPALTAGSKAPDISLPPMQGGKFSLASALDAGPVALVFFKVSCPVCQMAFPYFERLHQAYRGKNVRVVGISQDSAADTAAFAKRFGITFPLALDDTKKYPASNAYGLTNVPTLLLVTADGKIEVSSVAWSRDDLHKVSDYFAAATGAEKKELVHASDNVPAFKPG